MKISTKEMAVFAMLGAVMYASKIIMEFAPNIHLLGVFTIAITIVYRKKALYPIYIFVLLNGLPHGGFPIFICGLYFGEALCCYRGKCQKKCSPWYI